MYRIPFKILAFSCIHFIHIISMNYSSIIFSFHFILNQTVNIYRWNLKLASDILFSCFLAIRRGNILNRIQHVVLSLSFFLNRIYVISYEYILRLLLHMDTSDSNTQLYLVDCFEVCISSFKF